MKKIISPILFICSPFVPVFLSAQTIPVNDKPPRLSHPFINVSLNKIANSKPLDSFYQKLFTLKKTNSAVISVVHIGDSHIQPDFMTSVIRTGLQHFFGNTGRGLVFPYQLAQSNSPSDYFFSSNTGWEFNRLAHPEIPIASGISGYCIRTNNNDASINFKFINSDSTSKETFDHLKFFTGNNSSWLFRANHNSSPFVLKKEKTDSFVYKEVVLENAADSFSLLSLPSDSMKEFYGVSLENSKPGIIYHSIGVNGARYGSFNMAPLFWQQLTALNADLFIVSLGTNEAQKPDFNESVFQEEINSFLQKLKIASPNAAIIITTAADSYKHKKSNPILKRVCSTLSIYCAHHNIPIWDLYKISKGYGSAYSWRKNGLMNNDRIHFTPDGYRIQGNLFFNAIAKGYNNYLKTHKLH